MNSKLKIAEEILRNTKNIHLKFFINTYIINFDRIQSDNRELLEELDLLEYISFDKCINYIDNSRFNIKEWGLWEIPLSKVYLFYNEKNKQSFDLIVNDEENIFPSYIDENSNEIIANSIQEAIEKYKE